MTEDPSPKSNAFGIIFTGITILDGSDSSCLTARFPRNDRPIAVDGFIVPPHRSYIMFPEAAWDQGISSVDPIRLKLGRGFFRTNATAACVVLLDDEIVTIENLSPLSEDEPLRNAGFERVGAGPSSSGSIIELGDICTGQLDDDRKDNISYVSGLVVLPPARLMAGPSCGNKFTFKPQKEGTTTYAQFEPTKGVGVGFTVQNAVKITLTKISDPAKTRSIGLREFSLVFIEIGNAPLDAILEQAACHLGHVEYVDYHFGLYDNLLTKPSDHEMLHLPYVTRVPAMSMELVGGPNCPPAKYRA